MILHVQRVSYKIRRKKWDHESVKIGNFNCVFLWEFDFFFTEKGMFTMLDVVCVEERVFSCYD